MSEKELEKIFKGEVRKAGGIAYKFVSPGTTGVPDRLVMFPQGMTGFVEVKTPGKKPRAEQEYQIRKIRDFGFLVFVLDSPEQIPKIIEQIKRQEKTT